MTRSIEPDPQPPVQMLPNPNFEQQKAQAALAELTRRMKNGANNFYWIAALSALNSLLIEFGTNTYFVVGLASTLIVDSITVEISKSVSSGSMIIKLIGIAISFVIAGVFALFGLYANRGKRWAFLIGFILYVVDALIMLAFQDWMGLIFHALFLFGLFGGLRALNALSKLKKPDVLDFPQNIGAP